MRNFSTQVIVLWRSKDKVLRKYRELWRQNGGVKHINIKLTRITQKCNTRFAFSG